MTILIFKLFHIIEKEREKDTMLVPRLLLCTRSNVRANHDVVTAISDKSTYGMVFLSICIWMDPIRDFGRKMLQETMIHLFVYPLFVCEQ